MIDKVNAGLDVNLVAGIDNNEFVSERDKISNSVSENRFTELLATLASTTVDIIAANSINNARVANKIDYTPTTTSNIGNFATSVSSDGKLSAPTIKQSDIMQVGYDITLTEIDNIEGIKIKVDKTMRHQGFTDR